MPLPAEETWPISQSTTWRDHPIAIENPVGSVRKWTDRDGNSGETTMLFPYGYFADHLGADGDELDCYLGPAPDAAFVYVVHQLAKPDYKKFDEDKVFVGFESEAAAKEAYLAHRNDGEQSYGGMSAIPAARFIAKLKSRTGSGKIRHHRNEDPMPPTTIRALLGRMQRFDVSPADDGKIRINVYDHFATMGDKVKDGDESKFSADTLGQMATNWYARGGRLAMCQDHKSAAAPFVSAPGLAFYDAMAVVDGGKVVLFKKLADSVAVEPDVAQLAAEVMRFATETNPTPSPDGLWGWRCEVTPLGEDPREGLRNYRGISPMFVTDGTDEQGKPIGYVLFDVAATNAAFQAGCEITFSRGATPMPIPAKPAPPKTLDSGIDPGTNAHKTMRCPACGQDVFTTPDTAQWPPVVFVEHKTTEEQPCVGSGKPAFYMYSQPTAASTPTTAGAKTMNPDLMKKMGFADGATPTAEEKLSKYGAYAMSEGCTPEHLTAMAEDLEKHDEPAAKAMAAKFKKLGAVEAPAAEPAKPATMASDAEEEKAEKASLAVMARNLGLPETTPAQILAATAAGTVSLTRVEQIADARAMKAINERAATETAATKADQFVTMAVNGGFPGDAEALKAVARTDFATAEKLAGTYAKQGQTLFTRTQSGGSTGPTPAPAGSKRTGNVVRYGLDLSAKAKEIAAAEKVSFSRGLEIAAQRHPEMLENYDAQSNQ